MTENEVLEHVSNLAGDYKCFDEKLTHEESLILCNLIEEIQQYRAIGTIDEFKALKEKSAAKKAIERERKYLTVFDCPACNAELYSGQRYCDECGQAILDDYE